MSKNIMSNVQTKNQTSMKKLLLSQATFESMLLGIIQSGVTFEAREIPGGQIEVIFTGGF
jgi:hypothetical protein